MQDKQQQALARVESLRDDYVRVFGTPEGKRVLADLKLSTFVYKTSFNPDALQMANNEGMRKVVLHIDSMSKPKDKLKAKAIKEGATNE